MLSMFSIAGRERIAFQSEGKCVEPSKLVGHIEVRIFGPGNQQRRFVEVELFFRPLHQACEILDGVENLHRVA